MQLNAYLTFNGQCEEAFKFYERCLGGKIVAMMPHEGTPVAEHVPAEWRNKILHARLTVGDQVLGLGERTFDDTGLSAGEFDARPLRAGLEAR